MEEEFELEPLNLEVIKNTFTQILGADVDVKEKFDDNDEAFFYHIIEILDKSQKAEDDIYETSLLDLSPITTPLWEVLEMFLMKEYGPYTKDIILGWIVNRFDDEGKLLPLNIYDDEDKKSDIYLKDIKDLFNYIKKRK